MSKLRLFWARVFKRVCALFCYCLCFYQSKFEPRFDEITRIFYYASSLSFYTILSLSPVLLFIALIFVNPFSKAFEVETFFLPNSPDFMKIGDFFLQSFMRNNRTLGVIEISFIALAFFLFCENYRYIASQILNAPSRKYIHIGRVKIFLCWGFGTGLVLVSALSLLILFNIYIHRNIHNPYLLALLRWVAIYAYFLLLFSIPTKKAFKRKWHLLAWSGGTSLCWSLMKWGFVYYILYNRTYHELYGSISILWFLMSYIYISWLLLLLGLYGMQLCSHSD
ncbi:YihY family inner membrane protein [Helicobacter cynogastricus]|uniref:YihY family inner membrane protein n=1 Tax=Helicobacter cynogastricus TaxID=329937 RepID=UPI000CF03443|nr:YihY family inner membrane protein [Helicobacter cynogastricus]